MFVKKAGKKSKGSLKTALLALAVAVASAMLAAVLWVIDVTNGLRLDMSLILDASQTLCVYDADGSVIAEVSGAENRKNVSIDAVPAHVKNAFLAVEDTRFYTHPGIDVKRIAGALIADIKAGSFEQGASTLTQQLIKLSHLSSEKTLERKVQEAWLALELEQQYTKDEILEMYLNYVYFGGGAYGIQAASERYFGKDASELTVAEGAALAGIVKSPGNYAPHIDAAACKKRRDLVIDLMAENGFISSYQAREAKTEALAVTDGRAGDYPHGHYVEYAMEEACRLLGITHDELITGGYRIYTYMNRNVQEAAEALFADDSLFPESAGEEPVEAALVATSPETFGVTAMLGGRGHTVKRGLNRAADVLRQPGSTIKPVLVYAPAIDRYGYTAASVIIDEPTSFAGYSPQNFGGKYYGAVTLRESVARSLNVPAVKMLSNIGVAAGKSFAERVGIEFDENDTSLSLALGGFTYGVSPLMLAGAYGAFASGGVYEEPSCVSRITDSYGNALYERQISPARVMDEESAFILTSMLTSCVSEGTGRRADTGIPMAGKTGTTGLSESSGNKDAWMVAYNPEHVCAVWMGYDRTDSEQCLPSSVTGGTYPADLMARLFEILYPAEAAAPAFAVPDGVGELALDARSISSGGEVVLANAMTPASEVYTEYFAKGTGPSDYSAYWTVPSAVRSVSITAANAGKPLISFAPVQSFALYQLWRDGPDGSRLLREYAGDGGTVSHRDDTALYGVTYEYYVIPVHPELTSGNQPVCGPPSAKMAFTAVRPRLYAHQIE